ncbi:MAG: response regulator [Syntrophomonadaceae bacterium]
METILVVDSNLRFLNAVSKVLKDAGYKVLTAYDGTDGLKLAASDHPSLILCNMVLYGMSGLEVLEKISLDNSTGAIPFVFFTADYNIETLRKGMELGVDSIIFKPFSMEELLNVVRVKINKLRLAEKHAVTEYAGASAPVLLNKTGDMILLNISRKKKLVRKSNIEYIRASGPYSAVYLLDKGRILVRKLLKEWESILPGEEFVKVRRSAIININYIKDLEKWSPRSLRIVMQHSNESFITSQRFSVKVKARFTQV